MKSFLFGVLCLLLHVQWCVAQVPLSVVSGAVQNETGDAIPGAKVIVQDTRWGAISDEEGMFKLEGVAPGSYVIEVSAAGYVANLIPFSLEMGENRRLNIGLETAPVDRFWRTVSLAPASVSTRIDDERAPFARTDISASELQKRDAAQDVPFLLRYTPSLVVTSDAGAGVGYTGMRIRGSDATRINVTINGVPLNDAESHQVYWVDLPDLGSSSAGIQVQRGVGTSTNGPGAFGATVAVNTLSPQRHSMGRIAFSSGAFGTRRATFKWSSGVNDRGVFSEVRASRIVSSGFVDRASSDLSSLHMSGGKEWDGGQLVYTGLWGHERTYQAWYGVPLIGLTGDSDAIDAWAQNSYEYGYGTDSVRIADLKERGRQHNYYRYENQVDDYAQTHHQIHMDQRLGMWEMGLAFNATLGAGYYEQFKSDEDLAIYGIKDTTFTTGDVVRRRWLDNELFGIAGSAQRLFPSGSLQFGGGGYQYEGEHFGRLVWAEHAPGISPNHRYYDGMGVKQDVNLFGRGMHELLAGDLRMYAEMQWRQVDYKVGGTDNDLRDLMLDESLTFLNPKLGFDYQDRPGARYYASWSVGHREPSRTDYVDSPNAAVLPERLVDWELGGNWAGDRWRLGANGYFMDYKNQLVLTGDLNDVGSPIRSNVEESYRLGIEVEGRWSPLDGVVWQPNLTWSKNRIQSMTEVINDFDEDQPYRQEIQYTDAAIAFSPALIATSVLASEVWNSSFEDVDRSVILEWAMRHVGQQYLDNTGSEERSLPSYTVHDLRLRCSVSGAKDVLSVSVFVNNVLNLAYSSNGWAYSYQNGGPSTRVSEVYVYPQAGRYLTVGLDWSWH